MAGGGGWPGGPIWLGRDAGEGRSLSCPRGLLAKGCWGNFPGGVCKLKLPLTFRSWPPPPLRRCQEVGEAALCPVVGSTTTSSEESPASSGSLRAPKARLQYPPLPPAIARAFPWIVLVHSYCGHCCVCGPFPARAPPSRTRDTGRLKYLKVPHIASYFYGVCTGWSLPGMNSSIRCLWPTRPRPSRLRPNVTDLWEPSLSRGGYFFLLCAPHTLLFS